MNWLALEKQVIEIVYKTGAFIREAAAKFNRSDIEFKQGFNNLVSYVDKEAELRLVNELSKLIPGSGFLAEEGTHSKSTSGLTWIIDPLDGTTNFMHGAPPYAISIGLAEGDVLKLGVVYEITRDECFHASEGNPARCNNRIIHVSPVQALNESLLATGFPYYHSDKKEAYLHIIKVFLEKTHGIRRLGSASVDLAYVACGRFEGFFEYNLNPWDVAGGALIVQQAGGIVSDFQGGKNFLHGGELVAAGGIHREMVDVIKPIWFSGL
ncbi:MAG: inositol monophosphatase [Cyclobacteriaceae bacterium]|nr:inositol monophosphatase [Cyclobacteriaceae bacterium]MCX7636333.1 inositol monophosphatase [Cyclobacteriaceae bacterium]MDW8330310.1 inositol monophosphatase family protein [Cyclobacteriaceae bacterium]